MEKMRSFPSHRPLKEMALEFVITCKCLNHDSCRESVEDWQVGRDKGIARLSRASRVVLFPFYANRFPFPVEQVRIPRGSRDSADHIIIFRDSREICRLHFCASNLPYVES